MVEQASGDAPGDQPAKMSVTTTDNPLTSTLRETLQDYEIRLTGAPDLPSAPRPRAAEESGASLPPPPQQQPPDGSFPAWVPLTDHAAPVGVENPAGWDAAHRGVPRYRPVNYRLDRAMRPWGANAVETAFVLHMFHGVWLTAVSGRLAQSGLLLFPAREWVSGYGGLID